MENIGQVIRDWRKAAAVKQDSLAAMLGVSQATISHWETGRDAPGRRIAGRMVDIMSPSAAERLQCDRLVMSMQGGIRAAFDLDGVRLMMASRGLTEVWPRFSRLSGTRLADHLVDEAARLMHDHAFVRTVRRGEIAMVSAISDRHVTLDLDRGFRHRWIAVFRTYGQKMLVNMSYESCDQASPPGVERVIDFDTLVG